MIDLKSTIIDDTNEIADGITKHTREQYGRGLSNNEAHELRVAAVEAASKIMQAKIMAQVIDNKSFR